MNECPYSHHVMVITFERKKTSTLVVMYSWYLYFLNGLSLRNTLKALVIFSDEKLCVCIEMDSEIFRISYLQKKKSFSFIIDETVIRIGNQHFWLWFCIELVHSYVLEIYISQRREIYLLLKKIHWVISWKIWKTYSFYWRWYLVWWWSIQCIMIKKIYILQ